LVFADDWGRHPSSPQHLIRRLRQDFRVLWVNSIGTRQVKADSLTLRRGFEKLSNWQQGLKQVADSMWVIDLPMLPDMGTPFIRELNRKLVTGRLRRTLARLHFHQPIVVTTLPYMEWFIRDLPRRALVYYCTDDYSHWPSADRVTLQEADRDLSQRADLILAASHALVASHATAGTCEYFPHGVDYEHFASTSTQLTIPAVLGSLPRPRVGYFGLIYEKLDFALLTALANEHSHGSLVLIGPQAYCPPEFARLKNVHLLGKQPYEHLPEYLAGLDVLLMPYVDDDMIRQSGPLKLRECLASGKPTVSIDVPEVRVLEPHVRVASSRAEFLQHVRQLVREPEPASTVFARQKAVASDGWDRRAATLGRHLNRLSPAKNGVASKSSSGKIRRRVLHLRTVAGKGGGPEKTMLNSPRFLDDAYQLRLAYIRPEGDLEYDMPDRARRLGVDLVDIPERGPADPRTLGRLIQEIKEFRPHILHAHDYKTNVLAVTLSSWFHIPAITTLHGYVTRGGRLETYYRIDRWALRRIDHAIAVSPDLYQVLVDLKIPPARCSLVENAIDTQQYSRRKTVAVAKQALGRDSGRLTIGAAGRLSPEKGFDVLIQSADQLLAMGLNIELLIAGDGEQKSELQTLITRLGRDDRIHLLGHCGDLIDFYESLDVFVLSSLREGLPNVLLEAMALGVPVVATRVAGIPRLIAHEETGLLADAGNASDLTQAIARLLSDPGLAQRLQEAARRTIEGRYSFEVRMEKIRAIYDNILDCRRRRVKWVRKVCS
jgi:glycosyltransferase involved in cell wall biosynthesis